MECVNETATEVCGWRFLIDGKLPEAAYYMYNAALFNWAIAILFIVYQFMLYMKTKNTTLCWITGLFFAALYAASVFVKDMSIQIIFLILVFELAAILYMWIFK